MCRVIILLKSRVYEYRYEIKFEIDDISITKSVYCLFLRNAYIFKINKK